MEEHKIYLHAIRSLPGMSDKALRRILIAFENDPKKAWESNAIPDGPRLGPVLTSVWRDRHTIITDAPNLISTLQEQDIRIIAETDPEYPPLLKEIPDRPYLLYVRGKLPDPSLPLIAVVGSRKYTSYGRQVAESLVRDLSRAGIGIVSGLAFGIDKIAHETVLKENGYTLAVLGSGIDDAGITPHSHQALGKELLKTGALISEFPPGTTASAKNFPLRNRIVAGLTLGTLVIEAAEKSGSLITARLAVEYNREVYAVPGSIFSSLCQGTNALIKKGAIPITHAQDILQNLRLPAAKTKAGGAPANLTPTEEAIVTLLSYESLHIDEIVKQTGFSIVETSSTLMMLEIKKYTKHIGNQYYILTPT